MRLLVVDDEADTLAVVSAMLEAGGAEVRTAGSTAEAFSALGTWLPDLLVSDISLPDEDGYELIRKVRSLPAERGGATPAIALTARASAHDREQALSAGYQLHVAKPVDPLGLATVVASLAQSTTDRS